jgi:UPF0716 family protein affecting phage T7 exclusion
MYGNEIGLRPTLLLLVAQIHEGSDGRARPMYGNVIGLRPTLLLLVAQIREGSDGRARTNVRE